VSVSHDSCKAPLTFKGRKHGKSRCVELKKEFLEALLCMAYSVAVFPSIVAAYGHAHTC